MHIQETTILSCAYTPSVVFKENDPHRRRVPLPLARSTRCMSLSYLVMSLNRSGSIQKLGKHTLALNHPKKFHAIILECQIFLKLYSYIGKLTYSLYFFILWCFRSKTSKTFQIFISQGVYNNLRICWFFIVIYCVEKESSLNTFSLDSFFPEKYNI